MRRFGRADEEFRPVSLQTDHLMVLDSPWVKGLLISGLLHADDSG